MTVKYRNGMNVNTQIIMKILVFLIALYAIYKYRNKIIDFVQGTGNTDNDVDWSDDVADLETAAANLGRTL